MRFLGSNATEMLTALPETPTASVMNRSATCRAIGVPGNKLLSVTR